MGLAILLALSIAIEPVSANIFGDIVNWLKPKPLYIGGGIPISSTPAGATVKLNGVYIGTTSCQTVGCSRGSFIYYTTQDVTSKTLTFEKEGYVTASWVIFTTGPIGVTLVPVAVAKYPVLIQTYPSGARVTDYFTYEYLGTTPFSYGMTFNQEKMIRFTKEGYDEVILRIYYNGGTVSQILRKTYVAPTPTPYPIVTNTPRATVNPTHTPEPTYSWTPEPTYSWTPDPTYNWTPDPTSTSAPPSGKLNLGSTLLVLMVLLVAVLYLRRFF